MATGLFNLKQVNQAISQGAWSGYIAPRWVEYLVVAGGGGGGSGSNISGGGGGAGGLLTGIVTVAAGASYTVTVGAGGNGGSGTTIGTNGINSVFGSISSTGGGFGYQWNGSAIVVGSGGSGGGGYSSTISSGVSGQGNAGGTGVEFNSGGNVAAGGGGGAGTVGLAGTGSGTSGASGNGGAGIASAITGTVTAYAGGGGGGIRNTGTVYTVGAGGVGGGGTGSRGDFAGSAGSSNTGGGGGGAGYQSPYNVGLAGGSGIVVVRYPGNVVFFTGGTVNYNNGYIIHIFTASGTLAPTTPTVYNTSYQISRSLRFNVADSAYLNRLPASSSNRKTFTYSAWIKRCSFGADRDLFGVRIDGSNAFRFSFDSSDNLDAYNIASGAITGRLTTTQVFRDPSAWYHFVLAVDTTNATAGNRMRLYVNGAEITAFITDTQPTLNSDTQVNTVNNQYIGYFSAATANQYMTEINFIDGQALTPSSFGATSTTTGVWSPIQYTGTYGTNGFYLNFSDNSNTTAATLGKDYSGNGNNWTPNNFSVTAGAGNDSMVDSPTQYGFDTGVGGTVRGNYATLNPLSIGGTLANGNLDYTGPASYGIAPSTIGMTSGKWYFEMTATSTGVGCGLSIGSTSLTQYLGQNASGWSYFNDGLKYNNGSGASYGVAFTTGDVIGVVFDADAGTLVFYKNGATQGTAFTGLTSGPYFFTVSDGTSPDQRTCTANFGQRPFAYTAPSGFKALCTQNLPTPTIGATSATQAGKYFNTLLWTSNASVQSITGAGFQPDFVWVKSRTSNSANEGWHHLRDAVYGTAAGVIATNSNNSQFWIGTNYSITAFNSDGFSSGIYDGINGNPMVTWLWKANGSGSTNTSGSITSTVSVNTTSGFSIVAYTGVGGVSTVGHGLGVAPSMMIFKDRDVNANWPVYHKTLGNTSACLLNDTAASTATANWWNNTNPTSSVVTIGSNENTNLSKYVAYCFTEIAGFSAFGSYVGNGSANGPFVFTGMRPAFILVKASSGGSASSANWLILDSTRDSYNVAYNKLASNLASAENTGSIGDSTENNYDLLSNGFKARTTNGSSNESGTTYIYAAFASNPFKYSLAR